MIKEYLLHQEGISGRLPRYVGAVLLRLWIIFVNIHHTCLFFPAGNVRHPELAKDQTIRMIRMKQRLISPVRLVFDNRT